MVERYLSIAHPLRRYEFMSQIKAKPVFFFFFLSPPPRVSACPPKNAVQKPTQIDHSPHQSPHNNVKFNPNPKKTVAELSAARRPHRLGDHRAGTCLGAGKKGVRTIRHTYTTSSSFPCIHYALTPPPPPSSPRSLTHTARRRHGGGGHVARPRRPVPLLSPRPLLPPPQRGKGIRLMPLHGLRSTPTHPHTHTLTSLSPPPSLSHPHPTPPPPKHTQTDPLPPLSPRRARHRRGGG